MATVWLIGVLALVPASRAQNQEGLGYSPPKSIENVNAALASSSPARHVAALSLVPTLKLAPAQCTEMLAKIVEFLPRATTEDVQVAWLRAYGKLHLKPDETTSDPTWAENYDRFPRAADSAKRLQPFVASSTPRIQRAAAESLAYLLIAMIQRLDKPTVSPRFLERDFDTEQRIALGLATHPIMPLYPWLELFDGPIETFDAALEPYLPLVQSVLSSSDPSTVKWGLDALRNLAISASDNLPDPAVRREKELAVKPHQAKVKFVLFESVLKKLNQLTPSLLESLRSNNVEVREAAHRTAEAIANARRLARATQDYEATPGDPIIPLSDEEALLPGLRKLLPALFANLTAPDPVLRLRAMEALEYYDRDIWPDRAKVIQATHDSSPFVRWVAARALGKMLPKKPRDNEHADALAALSRLLSDTDIDARLAALSALQRWDEYGVGATDAVIVCVGRGDVDSRLAAIATLEAIKPEPTRATAVLVEALSQEDFRVRRAAAATLGRLGPKAKAAVPALENVLTDPDPELRRLAGEAILLIE